MNNKEKIKTAIDALEDKTSKLLSDGMLMTIILQILDNIQDTKLETKLKKSILEIIKEWHNEE